MHVEATCGSRGRNDAEVSGALSNFAEPNACEIVAGEISPNGWCRSTNPARLRSPLRKKEGLIVTTDQGRAQDLSRSVRNPRSTAQIAGHPIHPMLIPFPVVLVVSTLFCDLAFWRTGSSSWSAAAVWLLGGAVVFGVLAALAGLTDFIGERRIRELTDAWYHFIGNAVAIVLTIANFYLRYANGDPAVLPEGIVLSLIVVGIFVFTGWKGWEMVYRHRVGVADYDIGPK